MDGERRPASGFDLIGGRRPQVRSVSPRRASRNPLCGCRILRMPGARHAGRPAVVSHRQVTVCHATSPHTRYRRSLPRTASAAGPRCHRKDRPHRSATTGLSPPSGRRRRDRSDGRSAPATAPNRQVTSGRRLHRGRPPGRRRNRGTRRAERPPCGNSGRRDAYRYRRPAAQQKHTSTPGRNHGVCSSGNCSTAFSGSPASSPR
jgi:hypothetical protein